ncbi:MAG TPA: hypothetical protein VGS07_24120 [Thermoanaerobaculia bacterium]|jgi:tetratricopeptide (TPR) repeat protein|nr:hypothetical protein [Thermoanaerobaculia bacterium]
MAKKKPMPFDSFVADLIEAHEPSPMIRSTEDYAAARERQAAEAARERARAEQLWRQLQATEDRKAWRDLVVNDPEYQSWAFCETLCNESAELAEDDSRQALELVELALKLAPKVSGDEPLVCGIQEYAWMHLGNVCRARGDLKGAQEAFGRGKEFLVGGMMGILPSLILRDRLEALESALLRDQGKLAEALRKIDEATRSAVYRHGASQPALLWEKARLHRRLDQSEAALEALSRADREDRTSAPRLLLRIEIERSEALCDLGRYKEVKQLPGSLQKAARSFPVEGARLLCLEGRVAAGLGRLEEAEAILQRCLADHPKHAVANAALLSLEIAALYASQGQAAKLKSLAERTLQLTESLSQYPGAAATLKLCCRLVAQEKLTFERARQFVRDFARGIAGR